jgi:hypothetical protein
MEQAAEKISAMPIACGFVTWHGFSRADKANRRWRASDPAESSSNHSSASHHFSATSEVTRRHFLLLPLSFSAVCGPSPSTRLRFAVSYPFHDETVKWMGHGAFCRNIEGFAACSFEFCGAS